MCTIVYLLLGIITNYFIRFGGGIDLSLARRDDVRGDVCYCIDLETLLLAVAFAHFKAKGVKSRRGF